MKGLKYIDVVIDCERGMKLIMILIAKISKAYIENSFNLNWPFFFFM